jgi:hypothetical protein
MLKLLLFKNYPIELTIYYMLKLLLKIIGLLRIVFMVLKINYVLKA